MDRGIPTEEVLEKSRQRDGLHPKLLGLAFTLHMNVRRFMAVEADKEQPASAGYSAYRWHGMIIGETPTENKPPHFAIATVAWKVGAGATGSRKRFCSSPSSTMAAP
jgi:hypothetical protein